MTPARKLSGPSRVFLRMLGADTVPSLTPRTCNVTVGRQRMNRKLIIAYDGSPNSGDALALGRVLAEVLGATPVVVTVVPVLDHLASTEEAGADTEDAANDARAAARDHLKGFEAETRAVVAASPARGLHKIAEDEEPIVLVLGSTHRGPLGRAVIGSVGAALLSGAPCAIVVAPRGYAGREQQGLLRIGVAFNGAEESWPALRAGVSLAERLHASFTIVAAAGPPRYGYGSSYSALSGQPDVDLAHAAMVRTLDEAMEQIPRELPTKRYLPRGDPAKKIAEAASDFDLLILGSRGYGPVRRTLLGGVSAKLMRMAPCAVLVLPRGAGADPLVFDEGSEVSAAASPGA